MRALVISAIALASCVAMAGPARGSCIAMLTWRGDDYVGHQLRTAPGAKLTPRARVPACNDAGQNDPDTTTEVRRVSGVDTVFVISARGG